MKNLKVKVEKKENSQAEVNAVISWDELKSFRADALKKIGETLEVDGFRKGNVPENVIVEKFGEVFVLSEAANMAIYKAYPDILKENNLKPVGYPEITLTKVAENNDLEFKMTFSEYPEVKLPDYKKISAKVNGDQKEAEVTDADMKEAILRIRKYRAASESQKGKDCCDDKDKACDHKPVNPDEIKEEDLPELDDEFAKTMGEFKTLAEFEEKIKEEIKNQKELEGREQQRVSLSEEIIAASKFDVPQILVDSELEKMIAQMKDDIAKMGLNYDEYLKNANKKEEDIRTEWTEEAVKRAKMELILKEIAKEEGLKVDEDVLKRQVEQIASMHKDTDPMNISLYVENIMINEEVMKFLEGQK